ncbi:MAG: hypothetical protein VYC91_05430 [Acidobacteriota bacterium]|nr:hypothetical protein [Acidobacteriota bacterium]
MAGHKWVVIPICLLLSTTLWGAAPLGSSQSSSDRNQSVLSSLTGGWGRSSAEEEIRIAAYLKRQTEAYFNKLEQLDPENFMGMPFVADEEAAEILELTVSDLMISLKEMIDTFGLMESLFEQRPVDYSQSAALLWLTIVKDISLEKENAKHLKTLGLVDSNWPGIVEVSLPRLFSRILEPRLTESLRLQRR